MVGIRRRSEVMRTSCGLGDAALVQLLKVRREEEGGAKHKEVEENEGMKIGYQAVAPEADRKEFESAIIKSRLKISVLRLAKRCQRRHFYTLQPFKESWILAHMEQQQSISYRPYIKNMPIQLIEHHIFSLSDLRGRVTCWHLRL